MRLKMFYFLRGGRGGGSSKLLNTHTHKQLCYRPALRSKAGKVMLHRRLSSCPQLGGSASWSASPLLSRHTNPPCQTPPGQVYHPPPPPDETHNPPSPLARHTTPPLPSECILVEFKYLLTNAAKAFEFSKYIFLLRTKQ